jgi:periplasmic protein TonB
MPISMPEISLPMPSLPGFGPSTMSAAMEPVPLAPLDPTAQQVRASATESVRAAQQSDKPAFFVQWTTNLPGLTRRPTIDAAVAPPKYPELASKRNESGITTLESCISVEGRMVDVRLVRSSGSVSLDSATLAWAQTAKILPAEFNGQPMAVCGWRLDYEWRMTEGR